MKGEKGWEEESSENRRIGLIWCINGRFQEAMWPEPMVEVERRVVPAMRG
jgi:hypothetical protein